jgi:branched-chain amino acid transport system permease protein
MFMTLARLDLGHFYDVHLTLIQATLVGMVLAASMQVTLRAGVFSLASVGTWGLGAYTAGIMARDHDANTIVSLASVLALNAAIGFVLAIVFVRLRGVYLAMATVAFDLVVIVIALSTDSLTGGPLGLPGVPPVMQMWQVVLIVVVVACLLAWLERGHLGRTVATVGFDEDVAGALGIKVRSVQRRVFVLSAMLGALAGGMNALLFGNVSTDQFGFHLVTLALTTAVIGGLRSWVGAYIGAVIVYWLPEVLQPIAEWRNAVYGALLILVIALEPGGVIGLVRTGWRVLARRQRVGAEP